MEQVILIRDMICNGYYRHQNKKILACVFYIIKYTGSMHYGDIVQLTADGIRVNPHRLAPIGIKGDTRLWGILAEPKDKTSESASAVPHLILSSIPFNCWPRSFRLELKLQNKRGALEKAAESIESHGLNLLATHCTSSGFYHATWTMIVEILPESKYFKDHNLSTPLRELSNKTISNSQDHAGVLSATMYKLCRVIMDDIAKDSNIQLNRSEQSGSPWEISDGKKSTFLGVDFITADHEFIHYNLLEKDEESLSQAELQRVLPVQCRWLDHLAYLWANHNSAEQDTCIFVYKADTNMISSLRASDFKKIIETNHVDTPSPAIAMLNRREHYFRVALTEGPPPRRIETAISYEWHGSKKKDASNGTMGIVRLIAEQMANEKHNLIWVDNDITRRRYQDKDTQSDALCTNEEGHINVISTIPGYMHSKPIEEIEREIRQKVVNFETHNNGVVELQAKSSEIKARTMFLSTRYSYWTGSRKCRLELIYSMAKQYGFTITTANGDPDDMKNPDSIPRDAIERIRGCACFLQVIPRLSTNIYDESVQWILYERGASTALNKPSAYSVQVGSQSYSKDITAWSNYLKVEQEKQLYPFVGDDCDEQFCQSIKAAIHHLANRVDAAGHG